MAATSVKTAMAMALALLLAPAAASQVACALPASALYLGSGSQSADAQTLVPCLSGSAGSSGGEQETLTAACETACACRQLRNDANLYAVCVSTTAGFDCSAATNATDCSNASVSVSNEVGLGAGSASFSVSSDASGTVDDTDGSTITAEDIQQENTSSGSGSGGLKAWVWVVIGVAIVLVLGLVIFLFNWFKNRPLRGDNRSEVAQAVETSRSQPKDSDMAPVGLRESAARTTERSNPSQASRFSSGSYHKTFTAGTSASTLTETEIEVQREGGERVFSPISSHSSHSVGSSNYSQGVDADAALLVSGHAQQEGSHAHVGAQALTSFSEYSMSSDLGSFSSQITIEDDSDLDTNSTAPYPRKQSIEF